MKIDFNNVRRKALKCHDRLVRTLNEHLTESGCTVVVDTDQIEDDMNELRDLIGSIAMTFVDGNPAIANVFEEVYPGVDGMVVFNPESHDGVDADADDESSEPE